MPNNLTTSSSGSFNLNNNTSTTGFGNIVFGTSSTTSATFTNGSWAVPGSAYTLSKYKLWGGEVECYNSGGGNVMILISLLNMLGTTLWDQMLDNGAENDIEATLFNGIQDLYQKQKRKENLDILLKDDDEF